MKKTPTRMCVVCRTRSDKSSLVRIVKNKDGTIQLDKTGKNEGRGAYICSCAACLEKCIKTRSFNRAFKQQVDLKVYDDIKTNFEELK